MFRMKSLGCRMTSLYDAMASLGSGADSFGCRTEYLYSRVKSLSDAMASLSCSMMSFGGSMLFLFYSIKGCKYFVLTGLCYNTTSSHRALPYADIFCPFRA